MSAFSVLRRPQFRRIFLASSISNLGDSIAPIAVAFAILGTGHSAVELGIVLAARVAPSAVLSLLGGAWADRLPRRPIMVASDLIRLGTQGGFALLLLMPSPPLAAIVVLQAANGAASAFFRPASSGLLQEAVPVVERQPANALMSGTQNLSSVIGPGIAAALIAVAGNAVAVGVDAVSFGLSALFLAGVRVPPREPHPRTSILREIGDGVRAVVARPWAGLEILSFALFQFLPLAAFGVLGPLVADRDYAGATTWALVTGLVGAGAVAGDVVALRLRPRRPLLVANLVMIAAVPLFVALALRAPVAVLLVGGALWGFAISLADTLWLTTMQRHIPGNLIARVSSLDWMGSLVLRPIGLAVLPFVAAAIGAGPVLLGVGALVLVMYVALSASPSILRLRADDDPEPASEPVADGDSAGG